MSRGLPREKVISPGYSKDRRCCSGDSHWLKGFFFQDILRTEDVSRGFPTDTRKFPGIFWGRKVVSGGFPTDRRGFPGYSEDSRWCPGDSSRTDGDVLRNSEGTRFYPRLSPPGGHGFPRIPHQGKVVSSGFPMDTWWSLGDSLQVKAVSEASPWAVLVSQGSWGVERWCLLEFWGQK